MTSPTRNPKALTIERSALIAALSSPSIRANAEWCVACGASASVGPDVPEIVQQLGREDNPLRELIRPDFVRTLATTLSAADTNADWCVACGASKSTPPGAAVSNPAPLTDSDIDSIAARLLPRLQVGADG